MSINPHTSIRRLTQAEADEMHELGGDIVAERHEWLIESLSECHDTIDRIIEHARMYGAAGNALAREFTEFQVKLLPFLDDSVAERLNQFRDLRRNK